MSKTGKDRVVFNQRKYKIMVKLLRIKKGTMQDESFFKSDKGKYAKPMKDSIAKSVI